MPASSNNPRRWQGQHAHRQIAEVSGLVCSSLALKIGAVTPSSRSLSASRPEHGLVEGMFVDSKVLHELYSESVESYQPVTAFGKLAVERC